MIKNVLSVIKGGLNTHGRLGWVLTQREKTASTAAILNPTPAIPHRGREHGKAAPPPSPRGAGGKAAPGALLAALIALTLTACARPPIVIDSGCHAYRVIRASRADTVETLRQVLAHNQTWRARCARQK